MRQHHNSQSVHTVVFIAAVLYILLYFSLRTLETGVLILLCVV